jgi:hypothetical protein
MVLYELNPELTQNILTQFNDSNKKSIKINTGSLANYYNCGYNKTYVLRNALPSKYHFIKAYHGGIEVFKAGFLEWLNQYEEQTDLREEGIRKQAELEQQRIIEETEKRQQEIIERNRRLEIEKEQEEKKFEIEKQKVIAFIKTQSYWFKDFNTHADWYKKKKLDNYEREIEKALPGLSRDIRISMRSILKEAGFSV